MKYINFPYYINHSNSNLLPIRWEYISDRIKYFSWHDRLFTIQIFYSKNNVKVLIHNSHLFYIDSITTSNLYSAINYIEFILFEVVNHYILNDLYDIYTVHRMPIFDVYGLPDYDLPNF